MKITNMTSPATGKPVANQYIIETPEGHYFQSYKTIIALKKFGGGVYLEGGKNHKYSWDASPTTSKYLYKFLRSRGEYITNKKDIQAKIDSGEYKLKDLKK